MTTTDLAAFITTCLDEDQREAEEALRRTTTTRRMIGGRMVEDTVQPPEWRRSAWPPGRVLAEIEAKRKILDAVVPEIDAMERQIDGEWGVGGDPTDVSGTLLRMLALPYADRPGYREEWRP